VRATTQHSTAAAPARRSVRAASATVAPVVITSSTRAIREPATSPETAKTPRTFRARPAHGRAACGGPAATRAALRAYYRLMSPKDEFWVARLLTSPEKFERDRKRYGIDPARGDSLSYAFLVRPRLRLLWRLFRARWR